MTDPEAVGRRDHRDGEPDREATDRRRAVAEYRPPAFRPAAWLPGPHAQTLGGRLLRSRRSAAYRRVRLRTPDDDFLDLDLLSPGESDEEGPEGPTGTADLDLRLATGSADRWALVLHGLEGCSSSGYVVETCRRLAERGIGAAALNFRSRSGEPNLRPRFYHSGETGDLSFVLEALGERTGADRLGVVGFSLGGNVLLKYLGEREEATGERMAAGVAVSVPFDLSASAEVLERGMGRLYARHFLRSLRETVRAKAERHGHDYDLERVRAARTLREFDDAFTAPVHGFEDADDYYRSCSSARFLDRVRLPTLLLQARDDPFLPADALPERTIESSPWLVPGITRRGGHVGFVEGPHPLRTRFWAAEAAARFLDETLRNG